MNSQDSILALFENRAGEYDQDFVGVFTTRERAMVYAWQQEPTIQWISYLDSSYTFGHDPSWVDKTSPRYYIKPIIVDDPDVIN